MVKQDLVPKVSAVGHSDTKKEEKMFLINATSTMKIKKKKKKELDIMDIFCKGGLKNLANWK